MGVQTQALLVVGSKLGYRLLITRSSKKIESVYLPPPRFVTICNIPSLLR